jgi:hypothetical protein
MKLVTAISDELDKLTIMHSSIVLNIKDKPRVQKMLKYRIGLVVKSIQLETYVFGELNTNTTCVMNGCI